MEPRKKFFVPVCLYPHTKYRTRDGLEALFEKYSFAENQHVMVESVLNVLVMMIVMKW